MCGLSYPIAVEWMMVDGWPSASPMCWPLPGWVVPAVRSSPPIPPIGVASPGLLRHRGSQKWGWWAWAGCRVGLWWTDNLFMAVRPTLSGSDEGGVGIHDACRVTKV